MPQDKLTQVNLGDSTSIYTKIIKDNYIPKYLRDIVLVTGRKESYKYIPFIIDANNTDIDVYLNKLINLIKNELDINFGMGRLTSIFNNLETVMINDNLYIKTTLDKMYSIFDMDLIKLLPFINMSMKLANECVIEYYIKTYNEIDSESMPLFLDNRYLINEIDVPDDFKNRLLAIRDKTPDSFTDYKWYTDTFKYVVFGKGKLDTLNTKEISAVLMTWPLISIKQLFTLLGYNANYIGLMKTITYTLIYNNTIEESEIAEILEDVLTNKYNYLETLQEKLREAKEEIELYEEDDTTYEQEEIEEIKSKIRDTIKSIENLEEQINC